MSKAVEKMTPKYDHYLNDDHFAKNLVTRHLLKGADSLAKESVALYQCIFQVGKLQSKFEVERLEDVHKESLQAANSIFMAGKRAVTVQTACRVVLQKSGEQQMHEARKLLDKKRADLPKSLVEQLEWCISPTKKNTKIDRKRSAKDAGMDTT